MAGFFRVSDKPDWMPSSTLAYSADGSHASSLQQDEKEQQQDEPRKLNPAETDVLRRCLAFLGFRLLIIEATRNALTSDERKALASKESAVSLEDVIRDASESDEAFAARYPEGVNFKRVDLQQQFKRIPYRVHKVIGMIPDDLKRKLEAAISSFDEATVEAALRRVGAMCAAPTIDSNLKQQRADLWRPLPPSVVGKIARDMAAPRSQASTSSSRSSSCKFEITDEERTIVMNDRMFGEVDARVFRATKRIKDELTASIASCTETWPRLDTDYESLFLTEFSHYLQRYCGQREWTRTLHFFTQAPFKDNPAYAVDLCVTNGSGDPYVFNLIFEIKKCGLPLDELEAMTQLDECAAHAMKALPRRVVGLPFPFGITVTGYTVSVFAYVLTHDDQDLEKIYRIPLLKDAEIETMPAILDVLLSKERIAYFQALSRHMDGESSDNASDDGDATHQLAPLHLDDGADAYACPPLYGVAKKDWPCEDRALAEHRLFVTGFYAPLPNVRIFNNRVLKEVPERDADNILNAWKTAHPGCDVAGTVRVSQSEHYYFCDTSRRKRVLELPFLGSMWVDQRPTRIEQIDEPVQQLLRLLRAGLCHTDVRCENLTIGPDGRTSIIDFDMCQELGTDLPSGLITEYLERPARVFDRMRRLKREAGDDFESLILSWARARSTGPSMFSGREFAQQVFCARERVVGLLTKERGRLLAEGADDAIVQRVDAAIHRCERATLFA
ncbi:serine/threonine protein kinase [Salpingoeca rosetta]|uniref:Serine/threonine protein kinase n=1 Tax=Salpingoeca rosetta (strain ATCC 50818 / BSB-021) TaxID=946362 RepID=F2UJI2_SALR5|nr:serine/threonine protein kinase [Salpingoeca rosetta]EGD77281.1 serine/threonine protein kinase [Salpingoeca rosetta]|eukprot:XP_004990625.1 serine/threonine protein kinase [Salpingoeca rosetta]